MYAFLLKTYRRFLHFLRMPDDRSYARVGVSFKTKSLLSLFLLNVLLAGLWVFVLTLLGIKDLENVNSKLMNLSYGMLVLVAVIVMPFLEELIFRFPLKYSRNYVLQCIIAIVALFAPAEYKSAVYATARTYWKRIFWVFFYVMTSWFAFIHIYNYVDAKQLMLWSPLLTLTQFVTGLILGFIRIRFGFVWAWLYHGLFNLFFFSMAFMMGEESKPMNFETFVEKQMVRKDTLTVGKPDLTGYMFTCEDYILNIQASSDTATVFSGYYGITPDSIYFEQCTLERIMRLLTNDSITLLGSNEQRFDIEFKKIKNGKGDRTSKDLLLQRLYVAFEIKN